MNILIFNCGSSSQGFTLFKIGEKRTAEKIIWGKAKNVAAPSQVNSWLEWHSNTETFREQEDFPSHRIAAEAIINLLKRLNLYVDVIGHRFVNGGSFFEKAAEITPDVDKLLKKCLPLAPIHNPNSYSVIEVCRKKFPALPQYVVFDTAFHTGRPEFTSVYAIPQEMAEKNNWKKFGFHGLSYQDVSQKAALLLNKSLSSLKLIMCHLGTGGSSVCALKGGITFDTSMGYSPMMGLIMSTRCGDIDGEIILDMIRQGMTADQVSEILNKKSGLIGLSGYSSNLSEIIDAAENGNSSCQLAFEAYVHRLRGYIGNFIFTLNGVDALIFTDDLGVKSWKLRKAVCKESDFSGVLLNEEVNKLADCDKATLISSTKSRIPVWVIPNDEEKIIVEEMLKIIK